MSHKSYQFTDSVRYFWTAREEQALSQQSRGGKDQGNRSSVTGGKHMDHFVKHISQSLVSAGIPSQYIFYTANITALPGYFRPTKKWDMVVAAPGLLMAAIEMKSQVGPSFGNNFNNRTEEAIGSAEDIWVAFREGAFGKLSAPWLGYLFVLEDCHGSRSSVKVDEPHFQVFPEFSGASYTERYKHLCTRLVLEKKYTKACLLLAERERRDLAQNYWEPDSGLSGDTFMSSLIGHVVAAYSAYKPISDSPE